MSDVKNIIAIMGKAGSGKNTLLKNLVASNKVYHPIISCTTRPACQGEVHGVDYYFVTNEEFLVSAAQDDFIEYGEFNDWFYGVRYSQLVPAGEGINIGIFSPEGVELLRARQNINLFTVMVDCSDKERLLRQLTKEENPDVHAILHRFETDEYSFRHVRADLTIDNTSSYYTTDEGLLKIHQLLIYGQNK